MSIGITIDGTRKKHDLNRIWKGDGPERGSYDDVVRNIPLWIEQFPGAGTKVTISSLTMTIFLKLSSMFFSDLSFCSFFLRYLIDMLIGCSIFQIH